MSLIKIGCSIEEFDVLDSSNNYVAKSISEGKYSFGTVILAHFQDRGRGQREAIWQSEAKQNLLFSFGYPINERIQGNFFFISRAVSLAILNALQGLVTAEVQIKWPNDILVNGNKVAGILIENRISKDSYGVCGIGINVNQNYFEGLPYATSLSILEKKKFDRMTVLYLILSELNRYWKLLETKELRELQKNYDEKLFQRGKSVAFVTNGKSSTGILAGTSPEGLLLVEVDGVIRPYQASEIRLSY